MFGTWPSHEEVTLSRTVFLHVGVAKTGTTYLQRLLFANRELLRSNGVLYPGERPVAHFLASMDLRGAGFGGHEYPGAKGMWATVAKEVNQYAGSAVISHETLARTRRKVIKHAVDSFDTDDVRVVLTTRDLARQIPAVWQENVKNRNDQSYAEFLHDVLVGVARKRPRPGLPDLVPASSFWRPQNLSNLVKRWSHVVGPGNVILVTVPPPGAPRDELWNRFATATELPDLPYTFELESENVSLGAAEAELLRRIIPHVGPEIDWPKWENRVKRRFAERTLAPARTQGRIVVPEAWHEAVTEISEQMITTLQVPGIQVVGDLDDLRPRFETADGPLPDEVTDTELLESALVVLAKLAGAAPAPQRSIRLASRGVADRLKEKFRRD